MTLRLVKPSEPVKRRGGPRRPSKLGRDLFSREEGQRIRALIVNLGRTWGGYPKLAAHLGVSMDTVKCVASGRMRCSPALAILMARLARVPLEEVLAGPKVAS